MYRQDSENESAGKREQSRTPRLLSPPGPPWPQRRPAWRCTKPGSRHQHQQHRLGQQLPGRCVQRPLPGRLPERQGLPELLFSLPPLAAFCCRCVYYFHNAVGVTPATTITHIYSSKEVLTLFVAEAILVDLQGLSPISLRWCGSQSQICRGHRFHFTNKLLVDISKCE